MPKKILVAFDGSEPAKRAFKMALDMAEPFRAEVIVLAVAQLPEPAAMVESSPMLESATEHYEGDFQKLREMAASAGVAIDTHVVVGHAADQIIHQAAEEHVDLIVMGHRGKNLIQRWLLGSVSKRVISYSPCSVLIAR